MGDHEYDLSAAELEVLKVLWDGGPSTVRQVHAEVTGHGRKVAYTTVLTFLTRLENKGFVSSDKSEVAYVYRATVTRNRVTRSRLKTVIEQLYDGAAGPMVLHLVKNERLSADDIAALQNLIDKFDNKRKRD